MEMLSLQGGRTEIVDQHSPMRCTSAQALARERVGEGAEVASGGKGYFIYYVRQLKYIRTLN